MRANLYCFALLAAACGGLLGCAMTQVGAEWVDPAFTGQALRGARLVVTCDAADPTVQRICQDAMAAQVQAEGATPVQAPVPGPDGRPPQVAQMLAAARVAGASAVFASSVGLDYAVVSPTPTIGFGVAGFGSGSGVAGGVGVATGGQFATGYSASGPAQSNLNAQLDELARAVVGAARQAASSDARCRAARNEAFSTGVWLWLRARHDICCRS